MIRIAIMVAALLAATPTWAEQFTGRAWIATCTTQELTARIRCLAYIRGVADGLTSTRGIGIPDVVETQTLVDVGVMLIEPKPELPSATGKYVAGRSVQGDVALSALRPDGGSTHAMTACGTCGQEMESAGAPTVL